MKNIWILMLTVWGHGFFIENSLAMEQNFQEPLLLKTKPDAAMSPLKNQFAQAKLSTPEKANIACKKKSPHKAHKKMEACGTKPSPEIAKNNGSLLSKFRNSKNPMTTETQLLKVFQHMKKLKKGNLLDLYDERMSEPVSKPVTTSKGVTILGPLNLTTKEEMRKHEMILFATFGVQPMERALYKTVS